ncbi:MAG: murein hydrolase activator EnvC family protein [Acidimicrobiia bacterium]
MALAAAMALVPVLWTSASGASTQEDLDAARQRLSVARAAASDAAAAFSAAENKLAETQRRVAELEASIADLKGKAAELQGVVRERALYAYTHQGEGLDVVVDASSPVEAARKSKLLDQANQRDNSAVRKLAAINEDMRTQQRTLEIQETQQADVESQLEARNSDLQGKLADAQQATNALQAKLDSEIAAAQAAADAARRQQLEAERAALAASQPASSSTAAGTVIGTPVAGFQCPVSGAAYSDDFGGPRLHGGIDMMVGIGTPLVAVKSGRVQFNPYPDPAGGITAYLTGNDGNVYYYAHLSQVVGSDRTVSQGEIIGLSGMTGNAAAPHLHFEIRLGGVNGGKTDPYPTLRASGC